MKALITGASSGLGRDMAKVLASMGCELILVARRKERLEELAAMLPVDCRVIAADLSDPNACRELYERTKGDGVDILINNAGLGLFGPFDQTDLDAELTMLDTNIKALHILTKLFYKEFVGRNSGYILNVASSAAFLPGPLLSSYYASKAYVLRLSQALSEELRRRRSRVKISVLCPGPVRTEFDRVAGVTFSMKGLSSSYVASCAIRQMFRGRLVIIPGVTMKAAKAAQRFVPDSLLARIAYHVQKQKQDR